jgi:TatD DNase family protein
MKLIDTHCHLNFGAFNDNYKEVIERALQKEIGMIIVGAAKETTEKALAIANEYANDPVYATAGLHPTHVTDEAFDTDWFEDVLAEKKIVAVGETGIDLYRPKEQETFKLQKEVLQQHVELSKKTSKPMVLHSRGTDATLQQAYNTIFEALGDYSNGVLHCFTGESADIKKFLNHGLMVSFTGVITLAEEIAETCDSVPIEKMMVETDAPYITPKKYKPQQNEPMFVEEIARKVAEVKGMEYDDVVAQTTKNAVEFFSL